MDKIQVQKALDLLKAYQQEFPEHDQCDLRIWEASQILERELLK